MGGKSHPEIDRIINAAILYYKEGKTQQEIAERMEISRPKVSNLLSQAKEKGIVRFSIEDPRTELQDLSRKIKEKFSVEEVDVVSSMEDRTDNRRWVGSIAAESLARSCRKIRF